MCIFDDPQDTDEQESVRNGQILGNFHHSPMKKVEQIVRLQLHFTDTKK